MQDLHAQNKEELNWNAQGFAPNNKKLEEYTEPPHLIFSSAEELVEHDPRLSGCNVDQNFFRLACHHVRKDSNGLFGCRTTLENGKKVLKHDSWCCFKIKQVRKSYHVGHSARDILYDWQQPSIYISWNSRDKITLILCIDTPNELRVAIQDTWDQNLTERNDPYKWYCLIIDSLTDLYDTSVWKLRDLVREDVEKRRSPESIDFQRIHEIARHIIHSNETLEVALDTLNGIQQAYELFSKDSSSSTEQEMEFSFRYTQLELSRLRRTIKASFLRSRSLSDRIHNEINLAYNLVNQRDSFLMKTIAVMTLIYLPGSYIASIFGMNFFDFSSSSGLILSDKFWIYWVLTAIMTLLTIGIWMLWQSQREHTQKASTHVGMPNSQPSLVSRRFTWIGTEWRSAFRVKTKNIV
ncbi:uncharacterized protein K452DRAFT_260998 [Aplosporella prunicola CBS 121167]|uniref:Uncharacterized protein n=1 Tax=Aplosporella prunicola CBS 121167 TaxID=1176127 RepID=A0A6A6AXB0_9PEZI|nr:uncharacterized protein K452DRAFT_260998 [Aplosporella prunicola CBS 121167]KAF2135191.1 hypothetical protein K452DRAFT_260998 [Aplosporella prunicola CBS 121167]